jgi:hypothetical protein
MNGRRDYGSGLAEWGDARQIRRDRAESAYALMKLWAFIGILAILCGNYVLGGLFCGAAAVVGIINWR